MRGLGGGTRDEVPALSRRHLLTASGAIAAIALIAGCGDEPDQTETARFGDGDGGIVNYALWVEHVESDLYRQLAGSDLFSPAEREELTRIRQQEAAHVAALTRLVADLGAEPVPAPEAEFPRGDRPSTLALAAEIENLTAAAYLGQVPRIEDSRALRTMLAIHSVEGRHAAVIEALRGGAEAPPRAIAVPARVAAVSAALEPFAGP